jgi:hypothetical protein
MFHALETIGFYFRLSGAEVIVATQPNGDERTEHPWCLRRLRQTQNVCSISDEPRKCDLLIADAFMDAQYAARRARWASHADELAFLFPHDGATVRRRAAHLLRSWPHSLMAGTAIFVGDRRLSLDTVPPAFQRRAFYFPYLHPGLLTDEQLRRVFAVFRAVESRQYRIGFIGNRNPPERQGVLAECQRAIDQAGLRTQTLWVEYGDDDLQRGLTPEKYIAALGQMDFCICPAGWGRNWTHRVIEGLCRGSIPILPDAHLYGLGLRDSVNCLAVKGGDWHGAVMTALHLPLHKVQAMRRNVLNLRDTLLVPSAASHRFCDQFSTTVPLPR